MKKQLTALLMALCLALTLPATVLATDSPVDHCVCNGTSSEVNGHVCNSSTHFNQWNSTDRLPQSGTYHLMLDVVINGTWVIESSVTLCMNGKSITLNNGDDELPTIRIENGATLTLTNCDSSGSITHADGCKGSGIEICEGGTLVMYGGMIYGNSSTWHGGGVVNEGIFTMYDGDITENKAGDTASEKCGGGVYNDDGTFYMYGGNITDNTAYRGGGIYNSSSGMFRMNGGTIGSNTADSFGGGLYNSGETVILGGDIATNTSACGAGVYTPSNSTFTMQGGAITGNTASEDGGGLSSGENNVTLTLTGGANIFDNEVAAGGTGADWSIRGHRVDMTGFTGQIGSIYVSEEALAQNLTFVGNTGWIEEDTFENSGDFRQNLTGSGLTLQAPTGGSHHVNRVPTADKAESPKTTDAGIALYAATALLSLTGMAYTKKRK